MEKTGTETIEYFKHEGNQLQRRTIEDADERLPDITYWEWQNDGFLRPVSDEDCPYDAEDLKAARSKESALLDYWETTGVPPAEGCYDVQAVSETMMEELKFYPDDPDPEPRTFREQLGRMIDNPDQTFPAFFATTEY